jgi:hypothetical protein
MRKKLWLVTVIGLFFVSLLLFPATVQSQSQKIRVTVKNASIRLSPSMDSEVLRRPDMGAVFDVVKKVDEWYEIKFTSQVGVEITGYIHEMFVEVMTAEAIPEEKREQVTQPVEVEFIQQEDAAPKMEFQLHFMYPLGYGLEESSGYSDSFPFDLLTAATSTGTIEHMLKNPIGFGAAFNYMFMNGLGVQLRFDMNTKAAITDDSISVFDMSWQWQGMWDYTLSGDFPEGAQAWTVNGDVSLMVLSLNLFYKALGLGMIEPHFSGGVSYFTGNAAADTYVGYGMTWQDFWDVDWYTQYIDYFILPASVDEKIGSIGANIGGGVDIVFSRNIAFAIEARYFLTKKIEAMWDVMSGTYDSNINEDWTLTLEAADVAAIAEAIDLFILNPSFFSIMAAIKIFF